MRVSLVVSAVALLATAPAAAALYQLHYTGVSDTTTADLRISTVNTLNGAGGYDILAVSGNVSGDAVTVIAPLNPPGFSTDNTYFAANPIFRSGGVGFFSATKTYNLWGNSPGSYTLYGRVASGSYSPTSDGVLSVTAVPDPAVWGLMIVDFGMTGLATGRRSAAVTA